MADWSASMQQTFEYYLVDPATWKETRKLDNVLKSTISRDADAETLGSASFDVTGSLGECYIRTYLVVVQNGVTERFPLGTHLVQTPSSAFDGKLETVTLDAYTPLLELKESPPPIGYAILKDDTANIMDLAARLTREHARAPVVPATCDEKLDYDFVANTDDTWLSFLTDLTAIAKYTYDLDELGRVLFAPQQDVASLQPVWTFTDDNSSILYPDLTIDHDLYNIPNVVEVVTSDGSGYLYGRAVNEDENSPISTVNRGREIVHRVTNPNLPGSPTQAQIDEYAARLLRELSTLEYTISYSHGYCPVRVGDCVRLDYVRAGIRGQKAKVISQNIDCTPGCKVTEKAVFTISLWG